MKKLLLVLLAILLLSACSAEESSEREINLGFLRVPNDEAVAKQMGYIEDYFNEKDVKVNFIIVDSGVEANKAFASGSLDFATMGNTNGIVSLATGLDTELIWIHEVIGSSEALLVRKDSGIKDVANLKGKKIATTFSSTAHYILLNVLKEAGIEDDVSILDMQTLDIVAAWQRGDIDAAYTWEPSKSKILGLDGEVLVDSSDMIEKGYVTANVGLVRKAFAEENPDLVLGLLEQLNKASELYRNDKEKAVEAASKEIEIDYADAEFQMSGSVWLPLDELLSEKYFGTNDNKGDFIDIMYGTAEFLKDNKSIDEVPSREAFEKFINSKYIEELKKANE